MLWEIRFHHLRRKKLAHLS